MFRKNKQVYYYYPVISYKKVNLIKKIDGLKTAWRISNPEKSGTENFTLWDNKEKLIDRMYSDINDLKEYIKELENS